MNVKIENSGEPAVTQSLVVTIWQLISNHPFVLLLSFTALRFLYRSYASPLRKYPGPFIASGSRAWKVWSTYRGHTEHDHIDLHKKFGPIARIAPNELSFASPEAAREILAVGKGFHKTDFYSVFPPPENPDIFTEIRENVHAQKKRIAVTPYSLASMQQLTPWIEQTEQVLTGKLDQFAESGKDCDLGAWLHYFAFDVLGEVAFSKSFGFLDQGKDVDNAIRTIDQSQTYNGIVGQVPWWDHVLRRNPLWKYVPFLATKNALVTRTALGELTNRKSGTAVVDRRDLLSQLMEAQEKEDSKLTEGDVFAIAHGAIFAGSDSTASTMQTFMYYILSTPEVYQRLNDEISNATASGLLSEMVAYDESLKHLPYFQACLKEAMRIGPAVGLNITRYVPPTGAEVAGQSLPGGTRMAMNAWVTHRDNDIFGDDADAYRPERWLVDSKDEAGNQRVKTMDRYMFQFGGGSHICIGRHLAVYEINKVLPQLLRRYKFRLINPGKPLSHHSSFFVVQEGLDVKVAKR